MCYETNSTRGVAVVLDFFFHYLCKLYHENHSTRGVAVALDEIFSVTYVNSTTKTILPANAISYPL